MDRLPADHLPPLLRAQARGYYPAEAAVELLIAHGSWLRRTEFLDRCVQFEGWSRWSSDVDAAWIEWDQAVELLLDGSGVGCSSSEARILRLAAELAGEDTRTPLPDLLIGLDDHNQALVLQAVTHAMGNRPDHLHSLDELDRGGGSPGDVRALCARLDQAYRDHVMGGGGR